MASAGDQRTGEGDLFGLSSGHRDAEVGDRMARTVGAVASLSPAANGALDDAATQHVVERWNLPQQAMTPLEQSTLHTYGYITVRYNECKKKAIEGKAYARPTKNPGSVRRHACFRSNFAPTAPRVKLTNYVKQR